MCAMSPRLLRPIASGVHPEAADWRARVIANGGTVSGSTLQAVSRLCTSISSAGIRDRFYRLNLFCGDNLNAALVPLYRGPTFGGTTYGNATDTNNGPFVSGDYVETGASGGLRGNGTTKYLATGLPMNYTAIASERHLSVYKTINASSTDYSLGVYSTVSPATIYQFVRVSGLFQYYAGGNTATQSTTDSVGHWVGSGVANRSVYLDGELLASSSVGSETINNESLPFFVFARNSDGSPVGNSDECQAAYSIGLSMTGTQVSDYYAAMQSFQTALGRNA